MKFKLVVILLFAMILSVNSQDWYNYWQHLDPSEDTILGISSIKAKKFLEDKKANTVIVAIIDNGAELTHEDLQGVFWVNEDEIPDNQIDDDHNGYADDIHGWNFLGNSKGENIKMETTELTRYYGKLNESYKDLSLTDIPEENIQEYLKFLELKSEFDSIYNSKIQELEYNTKVISNYEAGDKIINDFLSKSDYSAEELRAIKSKDHAIMYYKSYMLQFYDSDISIDQFYKKKTSLEGELSTRLNPDFDDRAKIVGDDPYDLNDSIYGNNQVNARGPYHGTGVASLVGALNNDIGIDGIATHVKLMILRIVPNGDERDKDIALAIRYAVKNGADIINCSFAKKYSMNYEFVQGSIQLAEDRGILIVNGAGNMGTNNDEIPYFPTGLNQNNERSDIWLTVGASMPIDNENLIAYFSNYGKNSVDIFAPGYQVRNCALQNNYDFASGTSVSAPLVSGIAAVLKAYYPHLTGRELKTIILESAYVPKTKKVFVPNMDESIKKELSEISVSGGIANLYNAIMLVEQEYLRPESKK